MKAAMHHNDKTGETKVNVPYQAEFDKIAAMDDSIEPEVMRGVGQCTIKTKKKKLTV